MPENGSLRKHRILGTVHIDAPLLGAQNRVILAGLLSPFRSKTDVLAMPQEHESKKSLDRPLSVETSSMKVKT